METVTVKGPHLVYDFFFAREVSEMEREKINLSKTWELLFLSVTWRLSTKAKALSFIQTISAMTPAKGIYLFYCSRDTSSIPTFHDSNHLVVYKAYIRYRTEENRASLVIGYRRRVLLTRLKSLRRNTWAPRRSVDRWRTVIMTKVESHPPWCAPPPEMRVSKGLVEGKVMNPLWAGSCVDMPQVSCGWQVNVDLSKIAVWITDVSCRVSTHRNNRIRNLTIGMGGEWIFSIKSDAPKSFDQEQDESVFCRSTSSANRLRLLCKDIFHVKWNYHRNYPNPATPKPGV